MNIKEKIKHLRKVNKLTQAQLADQLGLTVGAISAWETGLKIPSQKRFIELSKILDVPVEYFFEENTTALEKDMITVPERKLLYQYRKLSNSNKARVDDYLDILSEYEVLKSADVVKDNVVSIHDYIRSNQNNEETAKEFVTPYVLGDTSRVINFNPRKKRKLLEVKGLKNGTSDAGNGIVNSEENVVQVCNVPVGADGIVEIAGNSMFPTIRKGDFIFINSELEPNHNDIVVIYDEEGVNCKRYRKFSDRIELHSDNKDLYPDPIVITANNEDFRIIGKAILD